MEGLHLFKHWKQQCLHKIDFSKKGSVDEDIVNIVNFINGADNFFTTSSCSGRIILVDGSCESTEVQKQNCSWLYVSHQKCQKHELIAGLQKTSGGAVLKFEPFVLHVQCRRLEDAQLLHSVAINSGFRNSGITVGKKGKIMMAVRSTHCLEVPLSHRGKLLVTDEYIGHLVQVANQKMDENKKRIDRFYSCLQSVLTVAEPTGNLSTVVENQSVYTHRRKRNKEQDVCKGNSQDKEAEIQSDDDPEIGLSPLLNDT
ncbi:tRNA wybutosine-synthesizing protein 3 homolog [Protopterus annectens]|uniref:tRNA wybutosine-synthesizing protein 3 homolog n=1 Tax=Protopterus annectens TaxID=7888 RepID=UPI001CFB2896|nr:tRNA wybutosine-synthesizing protein 3 homolog [Protopterus annectens]